jgi:hypothetical protein
MALHTNLLATSRAPQAPDDHTVHWSEVGGQGQRNQLGEAEAPTTV